MAAVTRRNARALQALLVSSVFAGGCGDGPKVAAEWRMADRTVDVLTDLPRGESAQGPDGIVDRYDNAQGRPVPARNGNISEAGTVDPGTTGLRG